MWFLVKKPPRNPRVAHRRIIGVAATLQLSIAKFAFDAGKIFGRNESESHVKILQNLERTKSQILKPYGFTAPRPT